MKWASPKLIKSKPNFTVFLSIVFTGPITNVPFVSIHIRAVSHWPHHTCIAQHLSERRRICFYGIFFLFIRLKIWIYFVKIIEFIQFMVYSQGDKRVHFDGITFCVRNGGYSAGFDAQNKVTIFNKQPERKNSSHMRVWMGYFFVSHSPHIHWWYYIIFSLELIRIVFFFSHHIKIDIIYWHFKFQTFLYILRITLLHYIACYKNNNNKITK